jgi:hypothetical protein
LIAAEWVDDRLEAKEEEEKIIFSLLQGTEENELKVISCKVDG